MLKKTVVELIGTFFLVLTVGLAVLPPGAGAMAPLAIGSVLMVFVYAGGHISGAHYNPAVTLAVHLRGLVTATELVGYWVAQIVGAVLAAVTVGALGVQAAGAPAELVVMPVLLAELLFTFALAYVVLNVATARGTEGNSYFGLAIGFTVTVGAYAVGGISGAAFNPAVVVGAVVMDMIPTGAIWIFLVANLGGGALAAAVFRGLAMGDDKPTTSTADQQAKLDPAGQPARR